MPLEKRPRPEADLFMELFLRIGKKWHRNVQALVASYSSLPLNVQEYGIRHAADGLLYPTCRGPADAQRVLSAKLGINIVFPEKAYLYGGMDSFPCATCVTNESLCDWSADQCKRSTPACVACPLALAYSRKEAIRLMRNGFVPAGQLKAFEQRAHTLYLSTPRGVGAYLYDLDDTDEPTWHARLWGD